MSQIGNLTQSSLRATIDGARALTDVVAGIDGGENEAVLSEIAELVFKARFAVADALKAAARLPVKFDQKKEGVTA